MTDMFKSRYRARITRPGYLPTCNTHKWQQVYRLQEGRCQAVEECGQVCNRLAQRAPPYHLCEKHEAGSDTLPCYLLELPTELRLMIFAYLFSAVVVPLQRPDVGVLRTNRQIYQEASSVLYGESEFTASVSASQVVLRGKEWSRESNSKSKKPGISFENALCGGGIGLIRNIKIEMEVGKDCRSAIGFGTRYLTIEEYVLYALRDSVRKLTDCLSSGGLNVLRSLEVKAKLHTGFDWTPEEYATAIFFALEPLQRLQVERPVLNLEASTSGAWRQNSYHNNLAKQHVASVLSNTTYLML